MGSQEPKLFLGHLCMKVEQSSDYLPGVIGILGYEVSLVDIVERMRTMRDVSPYPTDVTITSKQCYSFTCHRCRKLIKYQAPIQIRIFALLSLACITYCTTMVNVETV